MNKDNNNNPTNDISQLGNVDQIREILFGSQSRELKERFEKIENSIKAIQEEMRNKIEQSQLDFDDRINSEMESISKKIKNVVAGQQNDFADVRDNSLKMEKRIQGSMEVMEEELNSKREQLQKQQLEMRNSLRSQMDTLQDDLLSVIEGQFADMGEAKLSREDASDILMEAAMAMKGQSMSQQLSVVQTKTK